MDQGEHEIHLAIWRDSAVSPALLARWLVAPPLVWPHLPVGATY
jgi:hypothetical protein